MAEGLLYAELDSFSIIIVCQFLTHFGSWEGCSIFPIKQL